MDNDLSVAIEAAGVDIEAAIASFDPKRLEELEQEVDA